MLRRASSRWQPRLRKCFASAATASGDWLAAARERGLVDSVTSENCSKVLANWSSRSLQSTPSYCSAYVGQDPTASSLHVGNLLPLVLLKHMQMHGFRPIALIGTATGRIGDPSGKNRERPQLVEARLNENIAGIRRSVESVLCRNDSDDFYFQRLRAAGELPVADGGARGGSHALPEAAGVMVVENGPFYRDMNALDFIDKVGRNFRMASMLSRDSVKSRLQSESGLSFTEFTYQMLQAWDFWCLYRDHGCAVQIGGAD